MKKTIVILLSLLLASQTLASCGESATEVQETKAAETTATETTPAETEPDVFETMRGVDLQGRTVNISVSENISENGEGMPSSYLYIAGPEELVGENVQDNVFHRNIAVEELLNCQLNHMPLDLHYNEIDAYIANMVTAGDTSVDYYINDLGGLSRCSLKGYMLDVADDSNFTTNYFRFDTDSYYTEFMDNTAVGDKRFIITGDYFIDTLRASQVLYMNKEIARNVFQDEDYIYTLVLEDAWTMDKLNEVTEASYVDTNGNGEKDAGDQYGFIANTKGNGYGFFIFRYAMDCSVVAFDENRMPYLVETAQERMSTLADLLLTLNNSIGTTKTNTVGESLAIFTAGESLFTFFSKLGDIELDALRNFEGLGVVPYPRLDEVQERYQTTVHNTAEIGVLPVTAVGEPASAASAVIEAMSLHAHQYLLEDYYEVALKAKYAQDSYTAQMMDIIVDGIVNPFEMIYRSNMNDLPFKSIQDSIDKNTNVVASGFQSGFKFAQKQLNSLIETFVGE